MIHPVIGEILASIPQHDGAVGALDPVAMRAKEESEVPPLSDRVPVHSVEARTVTSGDGDIPVRVYTPHEADEYDVIVYLHGGAFFLGSLETHDGVARNLANATGHRVVSVGYRRAPEAPFPAGLDDCRAVVRWVAEHGQEIGWNGRNLAVVGDSSGATFAAVLAADEGAPVTHQVLLYPSLDLDFDTERFPSLRENGKGYFVEYESMLAFNAFYIEGGANPADPRVSPFKRESLAGLPPALIITAEYDPMRDEGEAYAKRLQDAGVPATAKRYDGATHGFMQHFAWLPEFAGSFDLVGEFLNGPGAK